MRRKIILILAFFAATAWAGEGFFGPEAELCRLAAPAPMLDGDLSDTCWQQAEVITGFVPYLAKDAPDPSEGRFAYDKDWLYFALTARTRQPGKLTATFGDGERVYRDDAIEVFLDVTHSHRQFWQVCFNAAGKALVIDPATKESGPGDWVKAAARIGQDAWFVEAAMAWKGFGLDGPPRRGIGIAFNRDHVESGPRAFSAWPPDLAKAQSLRRAELYPHLVLVGPAQQTEAVSRLSQQVSNLRERLALISKSAGAEAAAQQFLAKTGADLDGLERAVKAMKIEDLADASRLEERLRALTAELTEKYWEARFSRFFGPPGE